MNLRDRPSYGRTLLIRIEIKLISGIHPSRDRILGTVDISNTGESDGTDVRHNYTISYKDRNGRVFRRGEVNEWPRNQVSIWKLLLKVFQVGFDTSS